MQQMFKKPLPLTREQIYQEQLEVDPAYQAIVLLKPDGMETWAIPELINMLTEYGFKIEGIKFFEVCSEDGHILWDEDIRKTDNEIKIKFLTRLIDKFNGPSAALVVSREDGQNPWVFLDSIKGSDYRSPKHTLRGRLSYPIPDDIEDPELFCDLAIRTCIHLPKDEFEISILGRFLVRKDIILKYY